MVAILIGVIVLPSKTLEKIAFELFDGKCQVTRKHFQRTGFVIHHIQEIENDVLRKNYPRGDKGTEQYYQDLYPLIEEQPDRFALITNPIHNKLDNKRNGVTRLKMPNRIRFCNLALLTEHKKK